MGWSGTNFIFYQKKRNNWETKRGKGLISCWSFWFPFPTHCSSYQVEFECVRTQTKTTKDLIPLPSISSPPQRHQLSARWCVTQLPLPSALSSNKPSMHSKWWFHPSKSIRSIVKSALGAEGWGWGLGDQMILWHRLAHETLRIRKKGSEQKGGGGGGVILEMAFNMAQWPCRGIQYSHWQKKASIVEEPASFGKPFHFLINCALIKIKGRGEGNG